MRMESPQRVGKADLWGLETLDGSRIVELHGLLAAGTRQLLDARLWILLFAENHKLKECWSLSAAPSCLKIGAKHLESWGGRTSRAVV